MIIDSYDKLPLYKFLEIRDVMDCDESDIDKQIEIISILSDMTFEDVENLSLPEYNKLAEKSMFLSGEIKRKSPKKEYIINGMVYIPTLDLQSMNVSQYIDYTEYSKNNDIIGMLSSLLIPKYKKYGEYDKEKVMDDIKMLSVTDVNNLSGFFFSYSKNLMIVIHHYLVKKLKRTIRKEKDGKMKMELKMKLHSLLNGKPL